MTLPLVLLTLLNIASSLTNEELVECAEGRPWCRSIMESTPPATFDVQFLSTRGSFVVHIVTAWAPPMAQRFFVLAQLQYFQKSAVYRVLSVPTAKFVTQWGYRGVPAVDLAWNTYQLNNQTWSVQQPPGNKRGVFTFGTNAVNQTGHNPNCTHPTYCSQGFSVELYVNLADNSATGPGPYNLDAADFAIIGQIDEKDMALVDTFYSGYGEVQEECSGARPSVFCLRNETGGGWRGISFDRYLREGNDYITSQFPLMDFVLDVKLL